MVTFWRIFIYSWKNLGRNVWMNVATIFVFMMALLSVNVVLSVNVMVGRVVTLLENKVDVSVAFKAETPDAVINQARFFLTSLPQVSGITVISAADNLIAFKARHAGDAKTLAALDELKTNPLGAQLVIKAKQTDDYPFLMQAIKNPQYASFVESQTYEDHQAAIARLRDVGRAIRLAGAGLVAVFALFGFLIAFNAVRIAIYTQREEIGMMWLVGASPSFIRSPFILEGIWLAIIALLGTAGVVVPGLYWLEPILRPLFDGADPGVLTFFMTGWPTVLLIEGGGLLALVVVISWMTVGRYIRK